MHYRSVSKRLENLLGALAVALSDDRLGGETATGHAGAMGAALATLAQEPRPQHRATARAARPDAVRHGAIVDQLVAEGMRNGGPAATTDRSR